jgi:hypothetical protein
MNGSDDQPTIGWLSLTQPAPPGIWSDRTHAMRVMRGRGVILAAIGDEFGLTAERIRQILGRVFSRSLDNDRFGLVYC